MLEKNYIKEVMNYLKDRETLSNRKKIDKIFNGANKIIVELGDTLSNKESKFISEIIDTRAILIP